MQIRQWLKGIFRSAPVADVGRQLLRGGIKGGGYRVSLAGVTKPEAGWQAWVFACLQLRARAVSALKWRVTDRAGNELPRHWALELLDNPNPLLRRSEFFRLVSYWVDMNGNAFVWLRRGANGLPYQMWVLPSNRVQINVAETGTEYIIPGMSQTFQHWEIIHIRNLVPSTKTDYLMKGVSLLEIAAESILAQSELKEFMRRYTQNDGLPPLVAKAAENVEQETWTAWKQTWNQVMPNAQIAALLDGGMSVEPLMTAGVGSGNKSDLKIFDEMTKQDIAAVFGLSVAKITGENANYATALVNDYTFRVDTIEPIAQDIEEALTTGLQLYDPAIKITHVPFVFSDPDIARNDMTARLTAGVTTVNEERERLGESPVEFGDIRTINGVNVANLAAQASAPALPEAPPVQQGMITRGYGADDKFYAEWHSLDTMARENGAILGATFRRIFEELEAEIQRNVAAAQKPEAEVQQALETPVLHLFDADKWRRKLTAALGKDLTEFILESFGAALKQGGITGIDIESQFDAAIKAVLRETNFRAMQPIGTIEAELKNLIEKHYDKPADELRGIIAGKFDTLKTSRVNTISQTVSTFVVNASQKEAWKPYGFNKIWLSMRDGRVRWEHRQMDGQEVGIDELFLLPDGEATQHPAGEGLSAGNACNCRCYMRTQKPKQKE